MGSNSRHQAVKLALRGKGVYRPIPLDGKRPILRDWTNRASSRLDVVRQMWDGLDDTNIGIATGGRLVVLDMDPRNGGEASLAKLEKAVGSIGAPTVRTGGGGCHWYFLTDHPVPCSKLLPGIDIKGEGGQVVAPPSIHPETGKPYVFLNGSLPTPIPQALSSYFAKHAVEDEPERAPTDFISSGTRNDDLTSLAGWMRGKGANLHQIETALIALAKESGLSVKEAKVIAASIARKPDGREVEVAKLVRQMDIRELARKRRRQRDATYVDTPEETLQEALKLPRPPTTFTVTGLHPQGGNTLFIAQRKAGKTTTALNLVRALADRQPFLAEFEVAPVKGRIAYLNYELNANQCLQWFEDMKIRNTKRISLVNLRGRPGCLWTDENQVMFVEWLRRHRISTLVIDPAGRAWRGVVEDENSNSQVREFTSILDEIKERAGVSDLMLVHHIGKSHTEEGSERGRGASALEDWPDAIWALTKDESGVRSFAAEGRDVDLVAHDLDYEHETRSLTLCGARSTRRAQDKELGDAARRSVDQSKLLEIIEKLGGKASRTEILANAPWGDKKNRQLIVAAAAEGLVKISLGLRDATIVELVKGSDDPGS
jgi:hypothetical protein